MSKDVIQYLIQILGALRIDDVLDPDALTSLQMIQKAHRELKELEAARPTINLAGFGAANTPFSPR